MRRAAFLTYSVACYLTFFVTFLYSIGFIGNLWVAKTIDSGPVGPVGTALLVNLGLLSLFAIQHSGMARPAFKKVWTRLVPEAIERATYVLLSSVVLIVTYAYWQPIEGTVWSTSGVAAGILTGVYFLGWGTVFYSTLLIDHFDLFGIRQAMLYFQEKEVKQGPFVTPSLYKLVRHPLYVGWLLVMWAAPTMSVGHLLFAGVATSYILVAIKLEERDLIGEFGQHYVEYKRTTPALIPIPKRRSDDAVHAAH